MEWIHLGIKCKHISGKKNCIKSSSNDSDFELNVDMSKYSKLNRKYIHIYKIAAYHFSIKFSYTFIMFCILVLVCSK